MPFFRTGGLAQAVLGGWQVAGIVNVSSGQPVSRILVLSDTFRRGVFADQVGDPMVGERSSTACLLVQPGRLRAAGGGHVWQLRPRAVPSTWPPPVGPQLLEELLPDEHDAPAVQGRADQRVRSAPVAADPAVNGLDNTCSLEHGLQRRGRSFGQIIATRAAREIQLGLKLYW